MTYSTAEGFAHSRLSPGAVSAATQTISLAFAQDPTWAPIVESSSNAPDTADRYWSVFVSSAQRFPWSTATVIPDAGAEAPLAAVTVWLPPGAAELTPEEDAQLPALARELFGNERTDLLLDTAARFEAATPTGDFYYLSLLATHPAHRGRGFGMRLLAENLRELDALGAPSYLESSNPANDARYHALGYERHGTITLPSGLEISTFWRDPAGQ